MAELKKFIGIRNDVKAERFELGDLENAVNVDIDNTGKLTLRNGFLQKIAGAYHSLWSNGDLCLFVSGTQLRQLQSNLTTSIVIRSDLTAGLRMAYHSENGIIYYSNGRQTGIFSDSGNRTWGIVPPVYQPLAVNGFGSLEAGTYQFALTYVRSDGQESGTGIADVINVTTGAINFTDIPVSPDPDVTHKIIYVSPANGDVLYRAIVLANGATTATYIGAELQTPLENQFKQNAPAGQIISIFAGHCYVANGLWVNYSEPYGYELFDLRKYLGFDSPITMIAPMQDGMFVGTEKSIYYVEGREPSTMKANIKANYGVIPNTLCEVPTENIAGLDNLPNEKAMMWTSQEGICYGLNGGVIKNITNARYAYDPAIIGSALFTANDNGTQYVSVIRN